MASATQYGFHGSYLTKTEAETKANEVSGFIRERKVNGHIRYFVLTKKDGE